LLGPRFPSRRFFIVPLALLGLLALAGFVPRSAADDEGDDSMMGPPPGAPPAATGGRVAPPPRSAPVMDEAEMLLAAAAAGRQIDRHIDAALQREEQVASGPSDDAEFLRRISLDLVGVPPTEDEVRRFLASKESDKRAQEVERLLRDPGFGEHMADRWVRVLGAGEGRGRYGDGDAVRGWLAERIQTGVGMDQIVRELLTATGNTTENPALAFTVRFRDGGVPADIAGTSSRVFMGVQIQCAQCHDHPYEAWKQEEFAGFAAFFNLTQPRRADPMDPRSGFIVEDPTPRALARTRARGGEGADIRGAAKASPKFLGGDVYEDVDGATRRGALADWMTARENPWFAKAMVNRVWSWFFGRGIVNPVDDFRSDNPPSHPEIMSGLALGFAEAGYDLRFLARAIAGSATYGRSSALPPGTADDDVARRRVDLWFARGPVKPLSADQVFDSILRVTGMDDAFRRTNRNEIERIRRGLLSQFTTQIDDDEMNSTEQWAGTIPQGLLLMNGPLTEVGTRSGGPTDRKDRTGLAARENTLNRVLNETQDDGARVRRLYVITLGRVPSADETSQALRFATRGKGNDGWEDLFWVLLNSSEFMSNH
jgi:hypothetical protein